MKSNTQKQFVVNELRDNKVVSRNICLGKYITRLGAIINDLKNEGWEINGEYIDMEHGKDYVYRLVREPLRSLFS